MFLLLVSKILPPTSLVVPLIAKYLLFTFLMNCISILATVVIINWNFRGPRTHKMPNWIRAVFLKYLPVLLFIRRPKKTRLRWMMDMPSLGVHYHPYRHSQANNTQQIQVGHPTLQRPPNFSSSADVNSKEYHLRKGRDLDVAETTMATHPQHHPNCTINAQVLRKSSLEPPCEPNSPKDGDESIDTLYLTPEAYRATEAIEFIAEHLRSEDEYIQVIQLIFFLVYSLN